jgi:ABC-type phosphate transport system permease subunit
VTSIFGTAITWNPTQALPNFPVQILIWSESDDPADHKRAWASALVLLLFVLLTSLIARLFLARTRKKLSGS